MQKESLRCDLVFIANFANFIQSFNFREKRSETPVDTLQVFKKKNCNEYGVCGLLQICTSDLS
ncbi:hypothetical protein T03_3151 [Trichinella britovi]|uniref:Uncharacterized protein n=1 Tax=Trichinella britovi TaxID=45882 RepID=A0A0V1AJE7_TRIBR|nr:hypothetical protein T03_3151 [Trichinella britovi]